MDRDTSERLAWTLLGMVGRIDGYLEVGCGNGWRVRTVRSTGIRPALGIERTVAIRDACVSSAGVLVKDVTKRFDLNNCFELVTAFDIINYIPPEKYEIFIGNLLRHTEKWLVLTVSPPIHRLLASKSMVLDHEMTSKLSNFGSYSVYKRVE